MLLYVKVVETGSDDSFSDEDSPKKRRDILTRRPSYRKILNDLGGGEITGKSINDPYRLFLEASVTVIYIACERKIYKYRRCSPVLDRNPSAIVNCSPSA